MNDAMLRIIILFFINCAFSFAHQQLQLMYSACGVYIQLVLIDESAAASYSFHVGSFREKLFADQWQRMSPK
jgi:hypothetical protein